MRISLHLLLLFLANIVYAENVALVVELPSTTLTSGFQNEFSEELKIMEGQTVSFIASTSFPFDNTSAVIYEIIFEGSEAVFNFSKEDIIKIPGPATLRFRVFRNLSASNNSSVVFTNMFKVENGSSASVSPSNAVVIPTDATGSVEIILESSVDLVTWTEALPGTYSNTTEKRFFRLRAVTNTD